MGLELLDVFNRYFEIVNADTESLRDEVYRLRYQVYCIENQFEDINQFPDEKEVDAYDARSVHALIRHRESGIYAATVRLVLHDLRNEAAVFPVEKHCQAAFSSIGLDNSNLPRQQVAEISRFAVSKHFKRRVGEANTIAGVGPSPEAYVSENKGVRLLPHITLGLFAAVMKLSMANNIDYWYAVMEPSLLRLLTRFGIHFGKIGGLIDYHGKRQPCFASVRHLVQSMSEERKDVWNLVTNGGELIPSHLPAEIDDQQYVKLMNSKT